jgi:flagellar basal-body rod protein FlgG
MNGSLYIAASAALDHQRRVDVLTNNLANANTAGFKADDVTFQVATQDPGQEGDAELRRTAINNLPATLRLAGYTDFSAGASRPTGNALDVALEGNGFFSVSTPNGTQYTRQGNFTLNQDGVLVTQDGYPVLGEGGEITIEGQKVVIDEEGYIRVDGNEVDRLSLVMFDDLKTLTKVGSSLFTTTTPGQTPATAENVSVKQGYLENSNVNAIRVMTDMITEMRIVEAYQKMIRTADSADTKAVNELGRIL